MRGKDGVGVVEERVCVMRVRKVRRWRDDVRKVVWEKRERRRRWWRCR